MNDSFVAYSTARQPLWPPACPADLTEHDLGLSLHCEQYTANCRAIQETNDEYLDGFP
jgi:hypothetical protein